MAKADLHVHSIHSRHAADWFLKKLGAYESYTSPDEVYCQAKAKGMRFVTLTDHNKIEGALYLKNKYPKDCFTGVEATTYFPEDGCKVHLLIYGFSRQEWEEIDSLRQNIYNLRDYIKRRDLAYSVAHAAYSVNDRLTQSHLEKLILLFDIFEGINGSRDKMSNFGWMGILKNLTPERLATLQKKHGINPISDDSWVKGITGGSDDHAGLFIGATHTTAGAFSPEEYLFCLKDKLTTVGGRHNNYRTFVFTIYKIAYDFSEDKKLIISQPLLEQLHNSLFQGARFSWKDRLPLSRWKWLKSKDEGQEAFLRLMEEFRSGGKDDYERKFQIMFQYIANAADGFLKELFKVLEKDIKRGDISKIIRDVSSAIPAVFISIPFFTSLRHMFRSRTMINHMRREYVPVSRKGRKKILWFTDTLLDMNGVAETIKQTGRLAHEKMFEVQIAAAIDAKSDKACLPPNTLILPYFHTFSLPYYENLYLFIPSVLKAVELIYQAEPDRILVSAPGPIGLLGVLAAKLLNLPCSGIYHTDFSSQIIQISGQDDLAGTVEQYIKWFYSLMDEIKVPTKAYLDILKARNYPLHKLAYYNKAVETAVFKTEIQTRKFGVKKAVKPTLLYSGRVSKDKNIDFLFKIYEELTGVNPDMQLIIAGDGPCLERLKSKYIKIPGIKFFGRLPREALPELYCSADLLVFPSTTDTFGMAVLEAQACGLPAVVSNIGGPKEIVIHQETGMVLPANYLEAWTLAINKLLDIKKNHPKAFAIMQAKARENVLRKYTWEKSLGNLFGEEQKRDQVLQ
jgi:glycosyltransferase involved in cell wall biosynthesis